MNKKQNTNQNLPFAALILGGIDIKDTNIRWRDMQQGVEYNITNTNISIPHNTEATALGAAKVAAVGCGLVKDIESFKDVGESKKLKCNQSSVHKMNYVMWREYLDTMLTLSSNLKNIINNKD